MNQLTQWLKGHPWTAFTLAHTLALGIAWMAAVAVNEAEGDHLSTQASYMRLVPISR
jgi:hypothetical protein